LARQRAGLLEKRRLLDRALAAISEAEVSRAWKDYYNDLAALRESGDLDDLRTAALSKRHRELVAAFTGNDSEVEAGLKALYQDHANWPPEMKERMKEYGAEWN
jgi:hypothetical protein